MSDLEFIPGFCGLWLETLDCWVDIVSRKKNQFHNQKNIHVYLDKQCNV